MPTDLVTRLRETLTGEDTDEAMWKRIVTERREAAAEIARLRLEVAYLRGPAYRVSRTTPIEASDNG